MSGREAGRKGISKLTKGTKKFLAEELAKIIAEEMDEPGESE